MIELSSFAQFDGACLDILNLCRVPQTNLFAPPFDISIQTICQRILDIVENEKSLVVLAVDAIPYRLAKAIWRPDLMMPLASVFPSTSSVAWPAIISGLGPEQTGIPGVVYRGDTGELYHCFRNEAWGRGAPNPGGRLPETTFSFPPRLFDAFSINHSCQVIAGDLANWPSPWSEAFLPRKFRVSAAVPAAADRLVAMQTVRSSIAEVKALLTQSDRPTRIFCYINLDDYVHDFGYDGVMVEALAELEREIREWNLCGIDVVGISDHGMVPSRVTPEHVMAFERLGDEPLSRLGIGGAGRVRWLYPNARYEDRLVSRCEDLVGADGLVMTADTLQRLGFFKGDPTAIGIGEIVVMATGPNFPVPDARLIYEHGSMTADEMLVPFVHWRA